jgi:glutamine amidotransferase
MYNPTVAIVDYGMGNLLSVQRALEHCGAKVTVTSDPESIISANKVILPGVGAFADAMRELSRLGLDIAMRETCARGTPLMGICLGMQLLLDESDEFGKTAGLGIISGSVVPLPDKDTAGERLKIPNIGWSQLIYSDESKGWHATPLRDIKESESVYFLHSFMANPANPDHRIAEYIYGGHKVSAVIKCENIVGCQFHPEKSGEAGLKILRQFVSQ